MLLEKVLKLHLKKNRVGFLTEVYLILILNKKKNVVLECYVKVNKPNNYSVKLKYRNYHIYTQYSNKQTII